MKSLGLRSLSLSLDYRTSHGRLVDLFYVPCLAVSSRYWRAAGFFTSRSLALAAAGLPPFLAADGVMRLVASPRLEPEDFAAMTLGYAAREDIIERSLLRAFDHADADAIVRKRLEFLAWLVGEERLDVRLAVRDDGLGMYHEKFGIFFDEAGDAVAFTGSANETWGGLAGNFEGIDVFRSWNDERDRVSRKIRAFEELWQGDTYGTRTLELPEAVRDRLVQFRPRSRPSVDDSAIGQETNEPPLPQLDNSIEKPIELRTYQEDAIAAWVRAGGIGILEMATGTGKTVTALSAATQTLSERAGAVLVVVAPFIHLVDQWAQEMAAFGMYPVRCYGPTSAWRDSLDAEMDLVRLGVKQIAICVATHKALGNPALMDAVGRAGQGTVRMVVADEVHHLGAPKLFAPLDGFGFTLRLGLSATPQRWLDDVGNERLREYFGGTVFEFGLSEAIAGGFLTPYEYKPVIVELTQNEVASYGTLTRQIARLLESGATDIGPLLNRRAEILNAAEGKLGALRELVPQDKQHTHALFYSTPSRLQSVVELLMTHHRLRVHRFTYRESRAERQRLLAAFARGDIHALVAIRCLDEGVDVPGTRTAYLLASSGNPREFIQRRGRILRKAEGKDRAVIYDLITVPSYGRARTSSAWEMERGIVRRELQRFLEFADNALNPNDARGRLLPLQLQYELLDL